MSTEKLTSPFGPRLILVIVITFISSLAVGILTFDLIDNNKTVIDKLIKINESKNKVIYYDESLTLSALMYAYTADEMWRTRYDEHAVQLDRELGFLIDHAPSIQSSLNVKKTRQANEVLKSLETKALLLTDEGDKLQAQEILKSESYSLYKGTYHHRVKEFGVSIESEIKDAGANINKLNKILIFAIFLFIVLALSSWIYLFIRLNKSALQIQQTAQAKADFLAVMSHEIRTPMNGVLGMLSLLNESKLSHIQKEMLSAIKSCGDSLMMILNDVQDFSKLDAGEFELRENNFSIHKLLNETAYLSSYKLSRKGVDLKVQIADCVPEYFFGDENRMRQIIGNILTNAAKFTNEGEIVVEISVDKRQGRDFTAILSIRDTGIGISAEDQKKLFEAFSQVDSSMTRKYGGSGLGLAIIHKLIKVMKGKIELSSAPGEGTDITVQLPFKVGAKPFDIEGDVDSPVHDTDNIPRHKILLAEDNLINQKITTMMLEKIGYQCDIVANGIEAMAAQDNGKYSVILMDMQMPEMDGITAASKIIEKYGEEAPHIVALTANVFKEDRERCLQAGMKEFIAKPIDIETLKAVLYKLAGAKLPDEGDNTYINTDLLKRNFLGDMKLFAEVVEMFSEELPDTLHALSSSMESSDFYKLERAAHTLKGLARNFGAMSISETAYTLERLARTHSLEGADDLVKKLTYECNMLDLELAKSDFSKILV
tara:strand:- start:25481 stop:27619 length:2139 start_codon:yes stop_codon:yes gene_type:complete